MSPTALEANTPAPLTYTAFVGPKCVATGTLAEVLPVLKRRFEVDHGEGLLVFETDSCRQVDFDLRGSLDEVLARADAGATRAPGRPKLGVVSREVSLLPRHWEWLEEQEVGISGALRRLVDEARKNESGKARARRVRAAVSRFLTAMGGDRPNYEEAMRALFAGETKRFEELVARWPKDVKDFLVARARAASRAEAEDARSERP